MALGEGDLPQLIVEEVLDVLAGDEVGEHPGGGDGQHQGGEEPEEEPAADGGGHVSLTM